MAKPCSQAAAYLSSRSLASAGPSLRDSRVHPDTDRLLRHRAAAAARYQLHDVLVEDDHRRPLAEWPAMVPLGVALFRSYGQRAVSALTGTARSNQSHVAARLRAAGRILPVWRGGHRHRFCSGAALLRTMPRVRLRAV